MGTRMVCGYLTKGFIPDSREVAKLRKEILACASENGLEIVKIFQGEVMLETDQLHQCVYSLLDADERVLIVPTLMHLSGYGDGPLHVRKRLEEQGIQVLVARKPT